MSPEKKAKSNKNENDEDLLPFDIYRTELTRNSEKYNGSADLASKTTVHVTMDSNNVTNTNECDEDDEEDFIKIYFASGTVLKPSDEPYNLRSKINQANQELAKDEKSEFVNVPGKVTFDNTVVVLDSFEDIGTVSIGTERLQGADIFPDRHDDVNADDEVLAQVDLLKTNEQDDQNDVVCSTAERTLDTDTDDRAYSSGTSFSRSFSTDSDDPLFVNVIESGDEFKTIMDRNRKTRAEGSAIDEHVTYFPELFTHSQYKMYEISAGKQLNENDDDERANGVNIYVPKKLDVVELRNKLKEINQERKKTAVQVTNDGNKKTNCKLDRISVIRKVNSLATQQQQQQQQQRKTKQNDAGISERKTSFRRTLPRSSIKPRMTYYFELDTKGKLKPLNKNETCGNPDNHHNKSPKFFHINLRTANTDENSKPRIIKTPNADLFLEFQTDRSGNKGAKLVIKKKPTVDATAAVMKNKTAMAAFGGNERPRLPGYNGLRSEYGLSAEQLLERRRIKTERERRRKEFRQKKHEEEQKKRAENEKNFYKWLQQKKQVKKQSKTRYSYPMNRLTVSSARVSINSIHNQDQRKGSFALEDLFKIKDENSDWFNF